MEGKAARRNLPDAGSIPVTSAKGRPMQAGHALLVQAAQLADS